MSSSRDLHTFDVHWNQSTKRRLSEISAKKFRNCKTKFESKTCCWNVLTNSRCFMLEGSIVQFCPFCTLSRSVGLVREPWKEHMGSLKTSADWSVFDRASCLLPHGFHQFWYHFAGFHQYFSCSLQISLPRMKIRTRARWSSETRANTSVCSCSSLFSAWSLACLICW